MHKIKKINFDQVCSLLLLVFALLYIASGTLIDSSFYRGPFGPHHWVYTIGIMLVICSVWLFFDYTDFSPEPVTVYELSKALPFLIALLIYNQVLPYIGFLIAMPILLIVISLMFGAKLKWAIFSSLIMAGSCFVLFEIFLKISLGSGDLFR